MSGVKNHHRITVVVASIPQGRVATYGQVAKLAGLPKNARQVGTVLKNLSEESEIPWHRVVNSRGKISDRGDGVFAGLQRHLLTLEGVEFDAAGRLDLALYQMELT